MSRVKIKSVKDKEMSEMFNAAIGAGDTVNIHVCYPRHLQIREYVEKTAKVFDIFNNKCKFYESYPDMKHHQAEINMFIDGITETLAATNIDFSQYEWNLENLNDEQKKYFTEIYTGLKKSPVVLNLIKICDNLIVYRKYIGDPKTLSPKFILNMPGVEFCPFPFTRLNLKSVLVRVGDTNNAITQVGELVLNVLNKLLDLTYNLYKAVSAPDIDVDEFVKVVMVNIDKARKTIPRCNKAFDKLAESVEMLRSNFSGYYRDFIESNNSGIIVENFVIDVAKNTKADPQLMREFREIIRHYKKMAGANANNPQVKAILKKLNEQFSTFDKFSNVRKGEKDDDSDDSESDGVDIEDDIEDDNDNVAEPISSGGNRNEDTRDIDELVAELERS